MRSWAAPLALLAVLQGGCTVHGSGKGALPAFKMWTVEHPVAANLRTVRAGTFDVRIERVVVEEHRTALGPQYWLAVVKAVVVNRGSAPLLPEAVQAGWRVRSRSGTERSGTALVWGTGGWRHPDKTGEPTHLPPGAEGELRVQVEIGSKGAHDDPIAVSFADQTIELP